jgi:hypothetical protein
VAILPKVPPVTTTEAVLAIPRIAIWTGALKFPAGALERWRASKLDRGETVAALLARWAADLESGSRFLSFEPSRIELFDAIEWLTVDGIVRDLLELAAKCGATGEVTVVGDDERPVRSIYKLARKKLADAEGGTVDRRRIPDALKSIWPRLGPWLEKHRALDGAGRLGYIGADGRLAIPPVFERAWEFGEGQAIVVRRGDPWYHFIDPSGRVVSGPWSHAENYVDGLAAVSTFVNDRDQLAGYVDPKGKWVVKPVHESSKRFVSGLGVVETEGGQHQVIDASGRSVGPPTSYPPICGEGVAWIWDGAVYRCFAKTGKPAFERAVGGAGAFSEGLAAFIEPGAAKLGYLDARGATVIAPQFEEARPFTGGRAIVRLGTKYHIIDRTGALVSGPWQMVGEIAGGRHAVNVKGKWGYASAQSGELVVPARYPAAGPFFEGRAAAQHAKTKHFGHIDEEGEWIAPPIFDDAQSFSGGLARVKIDGAYGFVDRSGKLVCARWTDAQPGLTDGRAWVRL